MQVVLSKPFDDDSIIEVYIVENKDTPQDMMATLFKHDWDRVKTAVIKKEPETWMVDQIIERMEKKMGWQILHVSKPITVFY